MADKKEQIKKTTIKTADEIAQQQNYKDAQELINAVKEDLTSGSQVRMARGERAAQDFTGQLALLVLYQEIEAGYNLSAYKWINNFESVKIEAGNSKQFIRSIITGGDTYDQNQFVPNKISNPQIETTTISLYQEAADGTRSLTKYGYQYKKPITISRDVWLPYFLSGKLQEFIDDLATQLNDAYEIFRITIIQNMVTDLKTSIKNKITGTADNILSCFTNDIYPALTKMKFLSKDYNIDTAAQSVNSADKEELLILINNKTYTALNSGVLSQIFNSKLADLKTYINDENIVPTSKKLVSTTSDVAISVDGTDLIAENEVLVLNKKAIKHLYWVNAQESQSWAHNMTLELVLHVWGSFGFIPWGQGFYYKNDNLTVLPQ